MHAPRTARAGCFWAVALVAAVTLSACSTIYIHDPDLQARTDAADTAARAHPIDAVFADQLSALSAQDGKEALAVAHYMSAVRDRRVAEAAESDDPAARAEKIGKAIQDRSPYLFHQAEPPVDLLAKLVDFPEALQDDMDKRAERQASYLEFRALYRGSLTDLSCDTLRKAPTADLQTPLGRMQKACVEISAVVVTPFFGDNPGSDVRDAFNKLAEAEHDVATSTTQPVDTQIDDLLKSLQPPDATAAQSLGDLHAKLDVILKDATAVGALAGWTKLDTELGDLLQGSGCAAASPDTAACAKIVPASSAGKAQALWQLANAIAAVSDTAAANGRGGFAMQAAKAIVAANTHDAQIRVDAAKSLVEIRRHRLIALATEARYLLEAQAELKGDIHHCGPMVVADCATTLYGLSWERGRIPFILSQFKEDDLSRETWVSRTRVAANGQEAVLTAATASLKAYGEGGIKPELIAQLLNAAGLTALAASH